MKNTFLLTASVILTLLASSTDGFAQNATSNSAVSSFEALQKGKSVQISWTALYEANVNTHEIQKSINGSSFNTIGTLIAQNNAAPYRYNFLDATPTEGNNYYRLRTIDKQGKETLSNILMVNNGFGRTDIRILPNPVQGGVLNLQLQNINSGKYAIALYSSGGQKVFARSLDLSDGSLTETINLPQNLTHGIYVLQFTNAETRINKQLLIQ
ncbi:MAG: type sorting protein [Segetibacter sp.]|nr:type sorting protein [Segetibacter sp.]